MLKDFLSWTAIKMPKVVPYGTFHLIFFFGGLILSILIAYLLRKKSSKTLKWIIFGLSFFLLITEIYKQLFYTYYIGNGVYQNWIFPFQLCSIPMYIGLVLPFIKSEKVSKILLTFLASYNLLGGFIAFLEPSGLIHEYYTLTYHAFIWHMLITFMGILTGINQNIIYKKKDFKLNIIFFLCLCIIAFIINLLLSDTNMFFVGPNISSIIVFKTISTKFGWFINDLVYLPLLTLGAYICFYPFTKIKKSLTK